MSPLNRDLRARRRGSNSIELALLMGVFVSVLAGIMDYGWYFYQRSIAITAAREGCRAGALIPKDNTPDPETRATDRMQEDLASYGLSCGSGTGDCTYTASFVDAAPTEQLQCQVTMTYDSFTGVIPLPEQIQITSTSLLENQDI